MSEQPSLSAVTEFSRRKQDHIQISLKEESQSYVDQWDRLCFQHDPLPEIDFSEITITTQVFGEPLASPFFVSSMTLGHDEAFGLNQTMMAACQQRGWMMGVGSQRRQLFDPKAYEECESLRRKFPKLVLFGNIGLSQIIDTPVEKIESLVRSLSAQFLVVHTNPLQEAIQPEGTPQFRGGLKALERLCAELSVPVVLKETGCGFSRNGLSKLKSVGLKALDVSGRGGTHWGRVEGHRQNPEAIGYQVAETFKNWGHSTIDSVISALDAEMPCEVWASGGVRNGLQGAILLALGATKVGFAQPILKAALAGPATLDKLMDRYERELKTAMFCVGQKSLDKLVGNRDLLQWT